MGVDVDDLAAKVARLRKLHVHFRNDTAKRRGGEEILIDDPSGNPVELSSQFLDGEAWITLMHALNELGPLSRRPAFRPM